MTLERYGVKNHDCQAHNIVDLANSEIVLIFRYQALEPDAGVNEVPVGRIALPQSIRSAWMEAANHGLWCQKTVPLTTLACGADLPSIFVSAEAPDASNGFWYEEVGGTIPAEAVFRATRMTMEHTKPQWWDFMVGPPDAGR
ncbi:MAG: hypothetical protein QM765_36630 [Myxococcales bacterium]